MGEAHSPSPLCLEARKPTLLLHALFWGMHSAPALPSHLRVQCQPHSLMPASLFYLLSQVVQNAADERCCPPPVVAKPQHRENKATEWKWTPVYSVLQRREHDPRIWNWPALQVERQLRERTPEIELPALFPRQCSVMKSCQSVMIQKGKKKNTQECRTSVRMTGGYFASV